MLLSRPTARCLALLAILGWGDSALPATAPAQPAAASEDTKADRPAPDKLPHTTKIKDCCGYPLAAPGGYRLTYYWVAAQDEHSGEIGELDLYDLRGLYLGTFSRSFVDEVTMEGTALLADGRLINWAGRCPHGAGTCYQILDPTVYPSGRGAGERRLEPFRSIAVDPAAIPLGDAIYLRELVGVVLPDGTVHDGCVRADDVGLRIRRQHIDFFVGDRTSYRAIAGQLAGTEHATPVVADPRCRYLVDPEPHTVE